MDMKLVASACLYRGGEDDYYWIRSDKMCKILFLTISLLTATQVQFYLGSLNVSKENLLISKVYFLIYEIVL